MSAVLKPVEQRYVDIRFRGKTYRVTVEHAHMLANRGHLIAHRHGYPTKVTYEMEDDRMINVRGEPLPSGE